MELPGSRTAVLMRAKFVEYLIDFGLQKRTLAITLHNASLNKKFVQLLELDTYPGWSRHYCAVWSSSLTWSTLPDSGRGGFLKLLSKDTVRSEFNELYQHSKNHSTVMAQS